MVRRAALLVVVLLSVVVISSVRVFVMHVVIIVRVSGVPVCVAGAGMVSAPFPSVDSRDADVDGLRVWETVTHFCSCFRWRNDARMREGQLGSPLLLIWYRKIFV